MPDGDFSPGEFGRQLDRIERRIEKVENRLEDRYVPIGQYNSAIRVLDEKIDDVAESVRWTRRAVVLQLMALGAGILLLIIAAALR